MKYLFLILLLFPIVAYAYSPPPNCPTSGGTQALNYATATNAFSCNAVSTGSGTVTTNGSPASGNIAKFSGSTSITNGDLSGDIITSGTLATTVAKIAGVAVGTPSGTVNVAFTNGPTFVTPVLGVASGTSLALGGATIGSDSLGITGTATISSSVKAASFIPTGSTIPTDGFYLPTSNTSAIADNSQPITKFVGVSSAVDFFTMTNAATASPAIETIAVAGTDTNITLALTPKGTGVVNVTGPATFGSTVAMNAANVQMNFTVSYGNQGNNVSSNMNLNVSGYQMGSGAILSWSSGNANAAGDTFLSRGSGAATLQHGLADAATAVAQTVGVQNVAAGNSNVAGANWTFNGSKGTGTGAGGSIIFQTAPAGSTGTSVNPEVAAVTINPTGGVTLGSPTGGDKGAGTLNATNLYVNNVAVGTGNALTGTGLQQFAATTSAQFFGVISDETGGSGAVVGAASPVLTGTPAIAAATATTPAQFDGSTNVATTLFTVQNNTGGFVNKFRNPLFKILQRGTSGTIATPGTYQYTADGWMQTSIGAAATWNTLVGAAALGAPPIYSLLYFTGAASITDVDFKQRIESIDAADLYYVGAIDTITFVVYQDSGSTVTPKLTVNFPTAADNYGAVTNVVNAVSLQAVPTATYTTLSYTFATNVGFQKGMEVILDANVALNTTGKHFYLAAADVRITPGVATGLNATPPPIEIPDIGKEIVRNMRYYQKSFPQGAAPAQAAGATGASCVKNPIALGDPSLFVAFKPPMRGTPTFTTYNTTSSNANWRDLSNNSDVTVSVDPASIISDSGVLLATSGTVTTLGDILCIHWTASAEL